MLVDVRIRGADQRGVPAAAVLCMREARSLICVG